MMDISGMGDRRLRFLRVSLVSALACVLAACGANPDRMPVDEASEAQRLVFGAPQTVRTQFASQISTCWFTGGGPLDADYSFTMPDTAAPSEPFLIRVFDNGEEQSEVFQVQFYPHNDNTIVATRNLALPATLAEELDRSVEFWLLDPAQCRVNAEEVTAGGADDSEGPSAAEADVLRLPPLQDGDARRAQGAGDEDMHQAELRARGAIED